MATIKVKQIKSKIGYPVDQKRTLQALGLRKISQVVEVEVWAVLLLVVTREPRLVLVIRERLVSKVVRCLSSVVCRRLVSRTSITRSTLQ